MAPLQPRAGHLGLILPLCTSSATIGLALYQYPVFLGFLQPEHNLVGKPLGTWLAPVARHGAFLVAGLGLTSSIAGTVAAHWLRTHATLETTGVSNWYIYGSILAAAHSVATAYLVLDPLQKIVSRSAARQSTDASQPVQVFEDAHANEYDLKRWLAVHTARLILLDLPALWCFAEGAAQSFWVI